MHIKRIIFLLIVFPSILLSQENQDEKFVGVFINFGNLYITGLEIGVENTLTDHLEMRSSVKVNGFNTGDIKRNHIAFHQQLLYFPDRTQSSLFYGPGFQLGETNFYGKESGIDFVYSFFFGLTGNAGYVWRISDNFRLTTGVTLGMNYLKYKSNRDNVYGEFSPEILDDQLFMLNRHLEFAPELMLSLTYN